MPKHDAHRFGEPMAQLESYPSRTTAAAAAAAAAAAPASRH